VSVLKQDVGGLKQDVGVLKQDVGVLKQDVGVLKQDVSVLKQDVSVLKQDVCELNQGSAHLTEVTQGIMLHMDRNHASTVEGFAQIGREFALLRGEMNHRFDGVYDRLDRLEAKRRRPKNRE